MCDRAWPKRRLADVATWLSGGTPSTDNADYWDGEIPWISAASLRDFNIEYSNRCVTPLGAAHGTRLAPEGSTIFVVRGMSLKSEFRVGIAQRTVAFGQDCKALVPHHDVHPRYLAWAVKASAPKILTMVDEAGHGTGRLETRLVANHQIGVPPLAEQRRIAEILDVTDEQIAVGHRQREKSSEIRSAAFNDLMSSRGGTWPEEAIADVTAKFPGSSTIGPFGSNLVADDYRTSGVPVTFVRDIKASGFDWKSGVFVTHEKARELGAHSVQPGDLVVTKMGLPPCIAAEYPLSMEPGIITADVIRVRPDTQATTARWLSLAINHSAFEAQVRRIAGGVTRSKVTLSDFRRLKVKTPSLDEQCAIIHLSDIASKKMEIQREQLTKLHMLKQALMDDILTGRVRVPVGAVE